MNLTVMTNILMPAKHLIQSMAILIAQLLNSIQNRTLQTFQAVQKQTSSHQMNRFKLLLISRSNWRPMPETDTSFRLTEENKPKLI